MTSERPAQQIGGRSEADSLIADLVELGGAGVRVVDLSAGKPLAEAGSGVVRIGVHRAGPLPTDGLEAFDILLSPEASPPRPWVGVAPDRLEATLEQLRSQVERQPAAAAAAAQVLRMTLALPFDQALVLESLAYSMLLAAEGFRAWRTANPPRARGGDDGLRVAMAKDGATLRITLSRPGSRNAFDARMRDQLVEALAFAAEDPDAPLVELCGLGAAFSAGGDLDEFGQASDPGKAHLIRTLRSPTRMVQALGARATARVHGACIGAGIEVPAAAARVTAGPGAFFRLPEVSMGLIPGAGGTASIPRRIGRHRACYMAISGADIGLDTALAWGLVDAVEPAA